VRSWTEATLYPFEVTYYSSASNSDSASGQTVVNSSSSFSFDTNVPGNPFQTIERSSANTTESASATSAAGESRTTINASGSEVFFTSSESSSSSYSRTLGFSETFRSKANSTAEEFTSSSETTESFSEEDSTSRSDSGGGSFQTPLSSDRQTTIATTQEVFFATTESATTETTFQSLTTLTQEEGTGTTTVTIISEVTTSATTIAEAVATTTVNITTVGTESFEPYLANAANTIYEAEPNEVLAIASNRAISQWANAESQADYTTASRTTISASVESTALAVVDATASTQSYFNPSSSWSIQWQPTTFATTLITEIGNLFEVENTRTAIQTTAILTTQSVSQSFNAGGSQSGIYSTTENSSSFFSTETVSKWRSFSYQSTRIAIKTYQFTASATAQTTDSSSGKTGGSESGSTYSAEGNTTGIVSGVLAVAATEYNNPPPAGRDVYGPAGYSIADQVGGYPSFNNRTAANYMRYARRSRSAAGLIGLLPETDTFFSYTCDGTAYTLITESGTERGTDSAAVSVSGESVVAVLHTGKTLGGHPSQSETFVDSAAPGIYKEASGTTTFIADDTTYADSRPTRYVYPVPYYNGGIAQTTPVFTLRRNWTALPPSLYA
jgi:hypothetical protein